MKRIIICYLWITSLFAGSVLADIYVFRDEDGVVHYTNIEPPPQYRLDKVIRDHKKTHSSASSNGLRFGKRGATKVSPQVQSIISDAANALQVDQALVRAIIHAESSFNVNAISSKGASGLMQLMPATAKRYGVQDIFDPEQNIWGGVRYMRDLLAMFDDNVTLALAAYNAGENAVIRYGGIPPYRETQNYVERVIKLHQTYRDS